MKKVSIISLIALLAIVISSCGSSNNVVNNHGISKRKYNKGFFFQRKSNLKTAETKVKEADLKEEKSIAKAEKTETRKAKKENVITTSVESSDMVRIEPKQTSIDIVVSEDESEAGPLLDSDLDGIDWPVVENQPSATGESIDEMSYGDRNQSSENKSNKTNAAASQTGIIFVLAVVFAILIPPLGVAIYTNINWKRVLITLLLTLLFILPGMIYALLIVFDVI